MKLASWLVLFFFAMTVNAAHADEALKIIARSQVTVSDPGLSSGEWRWLREHRKIRLAVWLPMSPPWDITTGLNDYGGINADFIGIAAENLGVEINVIRYPDYTAALAALRAGQADFIARAGDNQRRDGLLLSKPYSPEAAVEVINTEKSAGDEIKTIAVSSAYDPEAVQARYPQAQIVKFSSNRHALEALAFRKIDLFFCDSTTARYLVNQSSLANLRIRSLDSPFLTSGFAFAAMPSMEVWITVLDKLLRVLPESVSVEIHRRWNGGIPLSLSEQEPGFSSLEQKWIKEHPRLRVAVAEDNPPIAFFDKSGQLRGIIADILTALHLRTGFTFDIQRYPTQREALKAVKDGKDDLVAGVTQDDIWLTDLITTRTWLYNSWIMAGRAHYTPGEINPAVVSLDGQAPDVWLRQQSSKQAEKVSTWRQGLDRVVSGESDMMTMPLIVANALLASKEYASLRILGSMDIDPMRFSFGVSQQSWPLVTILNKALINIPPEDLHAITRGGNAVNSFDAVSANQAQKSLPIAIGGVIVLLLLVFWFWQRRQRNRVEALRKACQQAVDASQAKSAFLTTMSHEIRTPVSAILGLLELVMKRPGDTPQNRQSVRVAWDAAQSLLLLIGNILDVSRIESGRLVLRPERAALRPLIEESVMLFEGLASQKGLVFEPEIDAELQGDVLVDRSRLRQILVNLAGNAIKYTDHGKVMLRAHLVERDGDYLLLRIEVEDTGEGIDEATRQRLFQPFALGSNGNVTQSSGLGLYICRTLAQMMGGSIDLQSEPGNGTQVTVMLKLPVMAELPETSITSPAQNQPRGALTILIVDDNPAGRMLLAQQLEWLGHRVISAENPKTALEILESRQPDAVISDSNMPGMSGFELAKVLHERYPALPVFGITADAREVVREDALEAGMRDCLFKPITLNMLTGMLASISPAIPSPVMHQCALEHNLPAALLEGDNLSLFFSLQISVLDETLEQFARWRNESGVSLRETLHKLRGGLQLLGVDELEALCREQEQTPDIAGINHLETEIHQLRSTLQHRLGTGLQPYRNVLHEIKETSASK